MGLQVGQEPKGGFIGLGLIVVLCSENKKRMRCRIVLFCYYAIVCYKMKNPLTSGPTLGETKASSPLFY